MLNNLFAGGGHLGVKDTLIMKGDRISFFFNLAT